MSDTAEGAVHETSTTGRDANCPVPSSANTVDVVRGYGADGNTADGAADEMIPVRNSAGGSHISEDSTRGAAEEGKGEGRPMAPCLRR